MTNLRTDEIVFFRNLTKIGTDENKAIHSILFFRENETGWFSWSKVKAISKSEIATRCYGLFCNSL